MNESNFATAALYFRFGMEAGILTDAQARDWALKIVDAFDTPPVEIVEVLTSRSTSHLHQCLKEIPGEGNLELAGRWLLWDLSCELAGSTVPEAQGTAARRAFQVAQSTALDEDLQFTFNRLEDTINLFEMGYGGSPDEGWRELSDVLQHFAVRPELFPNTSGMSA
ncbi:hypothetical protein EJP69_02905 [Variovorax gossypii]|uniref:Uncharacterized protein n=2 Tax=Variovorax TaxID=34072 RepID=A0A3S0H3B2_9BURK|nr:hypothetical protein [Variovorax gossypii]RTQ36707.1 hypothetical protein EJP69_02905 [Variovorax gossypii]